MGQDTVTALYVIYEGKKTECNYMENLEAFGLVKSHVVPLKVEKCGLDENTTDRKELVEIAFDEIMFQRYGVNSLRRFISHSLSNLTNEDKNILLNKRHIIDNRERKKENMRGYPSIRKEISAKIMELNCLDDSKKYILNSKEINLSWTVRNSYFQNELIFNDATS